MVLKNILFRLMIAIGGLAIALTIWASQWPQSAFRWQSTCRQPKRPESFAFSQVFHPIKGSTGIKGRPCALVYSAFFDHRDQDVKVVADSDMSCYRSINITCQIWYSSSRQPYVSELHFHSHMLEVEIGERLGALYSCKARPGIRDRPDAVSFFAANDACLHSPIFSMMLHEPQPPVHQFAACVPALFGNVRADDLVAFVEIHRLLGVEKFYFYKESVSKEVEKLLMSYQSEGVAEVLSWHAPFPDVGSYHNQQAMQYDCSLRNLQQSTWVAQFDIDELILPANRLNWSEMVTKFETNDTGVFTILNRDYRTDESITCGDDHNATTNSHRSITRTVNNSLVSAPISSYHLPVYFRRLSYYNVAFGAGQRSKILFRPERTDQARTHYALLRPGFIDVVLGYDKAVLAHYRNVPRSFSANAVLDTSLCTYGGILNDRIRSRMSTT